ncbi:hypothetical protein ATO8_11614 [Roseivivax marinus]|jgi:hypothetical protein|uniref:ParB/Sulfiredoxin domain-containing protein n=2 Tax=Roseivivax marinus TaxID=1379903 RepID=W4HJR6_9RHOB|nr:hypothetical protein [Roseivivax marinus]ETW12663.1 hypothetical protein ATO8_11614 [Roseivivax marinus]SEL18328.1 hypothetical protein SAMN05444413_106189 [Roseivivax marinus]
MTDESVSSRPRLMRMIEAGVPRKALRDLKNRVLYGRDAPLSDECVWIDPREITGIYARGGKTVFRRRHSGTVADGDWDLSWRPIDEAKKIAACNRHFVQGESWEETGIIDEMMARIARAGVFDGCRTREDVHRRYERIDRMYEEIARVRRLEPVISRPERFRREHGGVLVHIDRTGRPMLAGNGNHRLAIARILGLERIPAQIGAIHRQALEAGVMTDLRRPA